MLHVLVLRPVPTYHVLIYWYISWGYLGMGEEREEEREGVSGLGRCVQRAGGGGERGDEVLGHMAMSGGDAIGQ